MPRNEFNDLFSDDPNDLTLPSSVPTTVLVKKNVEDIDALVMSLSSLLNSELGAIENLRTRMQECESHLFGEENLALLNHRELSRLYTTAATAKYRTGQLVARILELLSKHSILSKYFEKLSAASTHPVSDEAIPREDVRELKSIILQALTEMRDSPDGD